MNPILCARLIQILTNITDKLQDKGCRLAEIAHMSGHC